MKIVLSEAATRGVLYKKVLLKRLQNSEENIYARVSFFNKVAGATDVFYHLNLKIFEHSL